MKKYISISKNVCTQLQYAAMFYAGSLGGDANGPRGMLGGVSKDQWRQSLMQNIFLLRKTYKLIAA